MNTPRMSSLIVAMLGVLVTFQVAAAPRDAAKDKAADKAKEEKVYVCTMADGSVELSNQAIAEQCEAIVDASDVPASNPTAGASSPLSSPRDSYASDAAGEGRTGGGSALSAPRGESDGGRGAAINGAVASVQPGAYLQAARGAYSGGTSASSDDGSSVPPASSRPNSPASPTGSNGSGAPLSVDPTPGGPTSNYPTPTPKTNPATIPTANSGAPASSADPNKLASYSNLMRQGAQTFQNALSSGTALDMTTYHPAYNPAVTRRYIGVGRNAYGL